MQTLMKEPGPGTGTGPLILKAKDPLTAELDRIMTLGWARARACGGQLGATYRIQMTPEACRFTESTRLIGYLNALGITHLYASPHLKSRPGSSHGYDIVDHGEINTELGSEDDLARLHDALRNAGMGMLLDWVPNHMATSRFNPYWMDVLENGPSSIYSRFFDIDWQPVKVDLSHKVLVPVLGDQYGIILERGELKLNYERGVFTLSYWDHLFPISPQSYAQILQINQDKLAATLGRENLEFQEFESILTAIRHLPPSTESDTARLAELRREKEVIKRRLATLTEKSAAVLDHAKAAVLVHNGQPNDPDSYRLMHELLETQSYRLAYWRVAAEEINYRRFFDINELVAIRMEDPEVFRTTHRLLMKWIAKGWVGALRIDHPDGLYDPRDYFTRIQSETLLVHCREALMEDVRQNSGQFDGDPPGWSALEEALRARCRAEVSGPRGPIPLFMVAEKILGRKERLPENWAISGTTGYDFLSAVNGIFVDRDNTRFLDAIYTRVIGKRIDFADLLYRCKKHIVTNALAAELRVLAHRLEKIAQSDHRTRDFTLGSLTDALQEIVACFPVYRTYIPTDGGEIDSRDRQYVEWAVARARTHAPVINASVFDFIRDIVLNNAPSRLSPQILADRMGFVGKLQQVTPPAMAKGMEDTSFYLYNRLISQNEVGAEPERLGVSVSEFHNRNKERLARAPHSLLSTTTHDTKRGEDVRLRINVISELPSEWRSFLQTGTSRCKMHKKEIGGVLFPDRNMEYLLFQTLLGAWPGGRLEPQERERFIVRFEQYALKAAREAKLHTSWTNPSPEYEGALAGYIRGILSKPWEDPFWEVFFSFQQTVARMGNQSSLSQVVLKMTVPGVPDIYQGDELWDLHLVDPDNRTPVDFPRRESMLATLRDRTSTPDATEALATELARDPEDPRLKMFVTWRSLSVRRDHPALFTSGSYLPLESTGPAGNHIVAFARMEGKQAAVTVCGRLFARLLHDQGLATPEMVTGVYWKDTYLILPPSLAQARFVDQFTGRHVTPVSDAGVTRLSLEEVFKTLPVGLLTLASPEVLG